MTEEKKIPDSVTIGFPIEAIEISVIQTENGTRGYLRMHTKSALTLIGEITRSLQEWNEEKKDE